MWVGGGEEGGTVLGRMVGMFVWFMLALLRLLLLSIVCYVYSEHLVFVDLENIGVQRL